MSEGKMEEELRNLIDEKWEWKVRKIAEKDFLAVFPNNQILDAFSRSKGCKTGLYNTWATFSKSTRDPSASAYLETGWVQLFNMPDRARNVDATTLIAELAGDVLAVDELSLIREGPVRVRMQAREIEKLRGYIEVFIDGVGREIKFVPEREHGKAAAGNQPPPPKKPEDNLDEGDDDDDLLSEDEAPKRTKGSTNKGMKGGQGYQGSTSGGKQVSNKPQEQSYTSSHNSMGGVETGHDPKPISVFDPAVGQIMNMEEFYKGRGTEKVSMNVGQGMENLNLPAESSQFAHKEQLVVHCEDGGTRMVDKDKWPRLALPGEDMEDNSQETYNISQESLGIGELVEDGGKGSNGGGCDEKSEEDDYTQTEEDKEDWEINKASRHKSIKRRKFYPTVAARKSLRGGIQHEGSLKRGCYTLYQPRYHTCITKLLYSFKFL
ncbi:unnamed protein product [Urochloa humidicola]